MGNDIAKGETRMAVAAMSNVMSLTKSDFMELRDKCMVAATTTAAAEAADGDGRDGNGAVATISRKDFLIAMAEVGIAELGDGEVLDRIFTMFDRTGDDRVAVREFVVGISPLATLGDHKSKLLLALEVLDVDGTGLLTADEMVSALGSINATASYFGDAVLPTAQIELFVKDVVNATPPTSTDEAALVEKVKYADHIDEMSSHPLFLQFVSGEGTVRYGTGTAK